MSNHKNKTNKTKNNKVRIKSLSLSFSQTKTKTSRNKNSINSGLKKFQSDVVSVFFEILLMIKLFHWNTFSFATHKATDELYDKFNANMDRFMEVLLGKTTTRIHGTGTGLKPCISLIDLDNKKELAIKISQFKSYLVNLDTNKYLRKSASTSSQMTNSDLFTIRDEMLADMNQFLYLLTLQ